MIKNLIHKVLMMKKFLLIFTPPTESHIRKVVDEWLSGRDFPHKMSILYGPAQFLNCAGLVLLNRSAILQGHHRGGHEMPDTVGVRLEARGPSISRSPALPSATTPLSRGGVGLGRGVPRSVGARPR